MTYGELPRDYVMRKFKVMSVYDVVKGGGSARGAQPTLALLLVHADVGYRGYGELMV